MLGVITIAVINELVWMEVLGLSDKVNMTLFACTTVLEMGRQFPKMGSK